MSKSLYRVWVFKFPHLNKLFLQLTRAHGALLVDPSTSRHRPQTAGSDVVTIKADLTGKAEIETPFTRTRSYIL